MGCEQAFPSDAGHGADIWYDHSRDTPSRDQVIFAYLLKLL